MKEALRTAQERYRSRNKNRQQAIPANRDYWNDENTNTENTELSTD